jgi:hypothetical protein
LLTFATLTQKWEKGPLASKEVKAKHIISQVSQPERIIVVNKKYVGSVNNMYVIGEKWVDLIGSLVWCHARRAEKREDKLHVLQIC